MLNEVLTDAVTTEHWVARLARRTLTSSYVISNTTDGIKSTISRAGVNTLLVDARLR